MSSIDEIRDARIAKLELLKAKGVNPYPAESKRELSLKEAIASFESLEKNEDVKWISGRIMSIRGQGAIVFITLNDGTGTFQGLLKKDILGDEKLEFFSAVADIGDFVEIQGKFFTTKRGEKTLEATDWRMLSKSLRPLPEKWHGLTNDDERYRKRYLDILMNNDLRALIEKRSAFWRHAREFMLAEGFLEIETPTLEITTGGAEAKPFATHHNDFDIPVYLRISVGELWQKRALAAGFPRVFEIGRVYRNEGSSPEHLQEFTNMEFYAAYMDYKEGRMFVERMIKDVVKKTFGFLEFDVKGFKIDLSKPEWDIIEYVPYVKKVTGVDVLTVTTEEMEAKLKELGVKYEGENRERLIDSLWKYCRKNIAGPVWLTNHPKIVSPLSKSLESNPELTERLQLILAGSEFSNSFSELNDPIDQQSRFEEQQKLIERGDDEAMMPDFEFVEMLEHAMPPAFGTAPLGDRMFAVLAGYSIRETVLFPLMRPIKEEKNKELSVVTAIINDGVKLEQWQILNTVAHLSAAFGARSKKKLFKFDSIQTGDKKNIKLNIRHAIMIKKVDSSEAIWNLSDKAQASGLEVAHFTREMIETTNDNKVAEQTKSKNQKDIDFLGLLIFGPKSKVEELTGSLKLY